MPFRKAHRLWLQVEAERGGVEGGSQSTISEAIFPELLNEQYSKYDKFMGNADVLVPEKILERPQRRLKEMEKLRKELFTATLDV